MHVRILNEFHEFLDVTWIKKYCIVLHCIVLYIHHINVAQGSGLFVKSAEQLAVCKRLYLSKNCLCFMIVPIWP